MDRHTGSEKEGEPRPLLPWQRRLGIALQVARGIRELHTAVYPVRERRRKRKGRKQRGKERKKDSVGAEGRERER